MNKRVLYGGVAVVLAALAAGAYVLWGGALNAPPAYRTAKVERGDLTAAVSATGTLNPVVSVQVGSQVSGQIKELYVDYNSQVKKGQLIARIDPEAFALKVNQASADLEATRASVLTQRANVMALRAEMSRAKVALADAEREHKRNLMLIEKNFVSAAARDKSQAAFEIAQEQVRTAEAQVAVGEAQVRNAEAVIRQREAQLASAKVDLDRTQIRAPVDGIVVKKSVEPGQTVAASLQAPELFVIAQDLRQMQVDTSIDEAEIGRVRVGQQATFTVDSFPGRTFRGTVSQVRKAAQVVQNVVTYTAVIGTSNADLSLFPGMTANVRIVTDTREKALRVPNAALRFRPAGQGPAAPDTKGAAAGAESSGPPDAKGGGQAFRERLTKELNLTTEQQAKVETIMNETRDRIREVNTDNATERQQQVQKLRAASRARIAEVLTPEQRTRFEAMSGGGAGGRTTAGRVYVLDDKGRPQAVNLRLGLTDGTYTEVVAGELAEGALVITGAGAEAGKSNPAAAQKGPRFGF